jgi:hypothetical protein
MKALFACFPVNQHLWVPLRASHVRHARGEGPALFVSCTSPPASTRWLRPVPRHEHGRCDGDRDRVAVLTASQTSIE